MKWWIRWRSMSFRLDSSAGSRNCSGVSGIFGSRITLGLVMRKVAMIAIILTSLVVAGQVSARVFHFHPWESFSFFGKQEESGENKTGQEDTSRIVSVEDDDFVPKAKKEKKRRKRREN